MTRLSNTQNSQTIPSVVASLALLCAEKLFISMIAGTTSWDSSEHRSLASQQRQWRTGAGEKDMDIGISIHIDLERLEHKTITLIYGPTCNFCTYRKKILVSLALQRLRYDDLQNVHELHTATRVRLWIR